MSGRPAPSRPAERRVRAFVALTIACVLAGAGYVAWAAARDDGTAGEEVSLPTASEQATNTEPASAGPDAPAASKSAPPEAIVFQHVKRDKSYAHIALTTPDAAGRRRITRLICERAHFSAGRARVWRASRG